MKNAPSHASPAGSAADENWGMPSDLSIDVNVNAGTPIQKACADMVRLANRLDISVWADFNGTRTLARPGDDPAAIHASWEREMASGRPDGQRFATSSR